MSEPLWEPMLRAGDLTVNVKVEEVATEKLSRKRKRKLYRKL